MGRKKAQWKPRAGASLESKERGDSRVEAWVKTKLAHVPKFLTHPLVAIVVGFVIAYGGPEDLLLKGIGFVAIALWLSFDLWSHVLQKGTQWRFVVGATGTSILLMLAMGCMYWNLNDKLKDQLADAYKNLEASVSMRATNNPYFSGFTVRNGGSTSIGRREIRCTPIMISRTNGTIAVTATGMAEVFPMTHAEMEPGNAETDMCIAGLGPVDPGCFDVIVAIVYHLSTQPDTQQVKRWRFVGVPWNGIFQWEEQPVGEARSYCALYLNKEAQAAYFREVPMGK